MRNIRRTMLATLAITVLAALTAQFAAASTLRVGICAVGEDDKEHISGHYSTIQAAVNAAAPGSKVLVCPGTYPEQVEITKPLTLKGVSSGNSGAAVVVPPPGGLIVPLGGFTVSAPQIFAHDVAGQVNVSNITVDAANNKITNCSSPSFIIGVYLLNAAGTIENVVARNQNTLGTSSCFNGVGIRTYGHAIPSEVTVRDNTVSAFDSMGILAQGTVETATIHDNSFTGDPGSVGIMIFGGVITTVSDNSATGGTSGGAGINVNGVQYAVVTNNHLSGNDYGIQVFAQQGEPNSDNNTITKNEIASSAVDGIDVCGDYNRIAGNTISGSTQSGVNLVTGPNFYGLPCTSNDNTVNDNAINGACAGVLVDPAASGNVIGDDNKMFNAVNLQLTGPTCAASPSPAARSSRTARAQPMSHRLAVQ